MEKDAKTFDHHSEEEWLQRKSSLKPLAHAIFKEIALSPFHWKEFSQTIERMGKEKHFLVYFKNSEIQKIFEKKVIVLSKCYQNAIILFFVQVKKKEEKELFIDGETIK